MSSTTTLYYQIKKRIYSSYCWISRHTRTWFLNSDTHRPKMDSLRLKKNQYHLNSLKNHHRLRYCWSDWSFNSCKIDANIITQVATPLFSTRMVIYLANYATFIFAWHPVTFTAVIQPSPLPRSSYNTQISIDWTQYQVVSPFLYHTPYIPSYFLYSLILCNHTMSYLLQ